MYAHQVIESLLEQERIAIDDKYKTLCAGFPKLISSAQKFHTVDLGEFNKISAQFHGEPLFSQKDGLDYLKLPYPITWIDYQGINGIPAEENEDKSSKRGALLGNFKENLIVINLFSFVDWAKRWLICPRSFLVDTKKGGVTSVKIFGNHSAEDIARDYRDDLGVVDITLKLLNCRNIVTENNIPPQALNKKRIKKGKQPLFTFKTLVVKPTGKKQKSIPKHLWENRIHLCRGHFKTYTEKAPLFGKYVGRYWWQPSVRGRNKKGVVMKDYEVTGS